MDLDAGPRGEGFRPYYITKIEELQLIVAEKSQNLRRLQAQRNELNAKGNLHALCYKLILKNNFSSYVAGGTYAAPGTGELCRRSR